MPKQTPYTRQVCFAIHLCLPLDVHASKQMLQRSPSWSQRRQRKATGQDGQDTRSISPSPRRDSAICITELSLSTALRSTENKQGIRRVLTAAHAIATLLHSLTVVHTASTAAHTSFNYEALKYSRNTLHSSKSSTVHPRTPHTAV